jgi:hypothetical protein
VANPMWVTTGTYRSVLVLDDVVVKIAKNDAGVRCNLLEAERSPLSSRYCRVVDCFDDGRILVMERADPIGDDFWRLQETPEMQRLLDYDPARPIHCPEPNGRNVGRSRDGALVMIDYGDEE